MQHTNRMRMSFPAAAALCAMFLFEVSAGAAATTAADTVPGAWQHHKVTFDYYGITTLYTCSGLENDVRLILRYFGARKDVKVSASGCPGGGPDTPTHNAWVDADFPHTQSPNDFSVKGEALKAAGSTSG